MMLPSITHTESGDFSVVMCETSSQLGSWRDRFMTDRAGGWH